MIRKGLYIAGSGGHQKSGRTPTTEARDTVTRVRLSLSHTAGDRRHIPVADQLWRAQRGADSPTSLLARYPTRRFRIHALAFVVCLFRGFLSYGNSVHPLQTSPSNFYVGGRSLSTCAWAAKR